jgi:hypothetical protein
MTQGLLSRDELAVRLSALPAAIHRDEEHLLLLEGGLLAARENLTAAEDALLLSGAIEGKNAEVRAAELRQATTSLRSQVGELEASVSRARAAVRLRQNEFSGLKSLARLLAAGAD